MSLLNADNAMDTAPLDDSLFWTLDKEHNTGPAGAMFSSIWIDSFNTGFAQGFARFGVLGTGMRMAVHDGWIYVAYVPLTEPSAFGERIATLVRTDVLDELAAHAQSMLARLPALETLRRDLGEGLGELTDTELAERFEAIADSARTLVAERYAGMPVIALSGEFAIVAQDAGLDPEAAFAALGHVPATAATSSSIAGMASRIDREAPSLAGRLRAGEAVAIDELAALVDVADALDADRDLLCASTPSAPTLGESPELLIELLRRYLDLPTIDSTTSPDALLADAERARLAQQWRDATSRAMLLWFGLVRRAGLEAGRRLVAADRLGDAADVMHLVAEELVVALREGSDVTAIVAERSDAVAAAQASRPPMVLGTPPSGPPPGVDQLPPAAQRHMRRIQWFVSRLVPPTGPAPADSAELSGPAGVAASPGTHVGPARVVHGPEDFVSVEPGDVVVCTTTSPVWNAVLAIAAAVVTETGGFVSHAALIARELRIPAVVGVRGATGTIADGSILRVDGTAGTVEVQS